MVVEFFSQIIVFLFLVDSDTSLLVSIPAFCAIIIQMWKVQKALGLTLGDPLSGPVLIYHPPFKENKLTVLIYQPPSKTKK